MLYSKIEILKKDSKQTRANKQRVLDAIERMNDMLSEDGQWFIDAMKALGPLAFSKSKPEYVAKVSWEFMRDQDIEVRLYSAKSSKTLAMFTGGKPFVLFLNRRNLARSIPSIDGSLMHEGIHAADHYDKTGRWGHGSNSSKGKAKSGPYRGGNLVKGHLEERDRAAKGAA